MCQRGETKTLFEIIGEISRRGIEIGETPQEALVTRIKEELMI